MATYYVRNDGNDLNAGTGYLASQAFQTITKAISMLSADWETIWVAPGFYPESISVTSNFSNSKILGDPTCLQFLDITPGVVWISGSNTAHGFVDGLRNTTVAIVPGTGSPFIVENVKITMGNWWACDLTAGILRSCEIYGDVNLRGSAETVEAIGCKFFNCYAQVGSTQFTRCYFDSVDFRPNSTTSTTFYECLINLCYIKTINLGTTTPVYSMSFYSCIINYRNTMEGGSPLSQVTGKRPGFYFEGCTINDAYPMIRQEGQRNCAIQIKGCQIKNCGKVYDYPGTPSSTVNHSLYLEFITIENCISPFTNTEVAKPVAFSEGVSFKNVNVLDTTNVSIDNTLVVEGPNSFIGTPATYPVRRTLLDTDRTGIFSTTSNLLSGYTKNLLARSYTRTPMLFLWVPRWPGKQANVTVRVQYSEAFSSSYGVFGTAGMTRGQVQDPQYASTAEHDFTFSCPKVSEWYHDWIPVMIFVKIPPGTPQKTVKLGSVKVNYIAT